MVSADCDVLGMVAIFSYNLDVAIQNFENKDVQLYTLSDYDTLIKKALEINYVDKADLESLVDWRKSPQKWAEKKF